MSTSVRFQTYENRTTVRHGPASVTTLSDVVYGIIFNVIYDFNLVDRWRQWLTKKQAEAYVPLITVSTVWGWSREMARPRAFRYFFSCSRLDNSCCLHMHKKHTNTYLYYTQVHPTVISGQCLDASAHCFILRNISRLLPHIGHNWPSLSVLLAPKRVCESMWMYANVTEQTRKCLSRIINSLRADIPSSLSDTYTGPWPLSVLTHWGPP